jgi:phospholipase/carboxylesterase
MNITTKGPRVEEASGVLIMLHGRGASAENIIARYDLLQHNRVAALAPDAPGGVWYPYSFMAPIAQNEPSLSNALDTIQRIVDDLMARGVTSRKIALFGFSQGACLASEFVARNPRRYGAVMALTGGLIGAEGELPERDGNLEGTPVFLGTSDPDPYIPFSRVQETATTLEAIGATVQLERYPGMSHIIHENQLAVCRHLLDRMEEDA